MLRDAQKASAPGVVDVVTYSAAVTACRASGEWQQALELLEVSDPSGVNLVLCDRQQALATSHGTHLGFARLSLALFDDEIG